MKEAQPSAGSIGTSSRATSRLAPARDICNRLHPDSQRADGDQFVDRRTCRRGVRQIDEVENHPARLAIQVAIDETSPFHGQGNGVAGSPANHIGQQVTVIGEVVAAEPAIEVGRQKGNPVALGRRPDDQSRDVGAGRAHPGRLGRVDRKRRHVGQEHLRIVSGSETIQDTSKGHDVALVEARQGYVPPACRGWLAARLGPVPFLPRPRGESEVGMQGPPGTAEVLCD